MNPDPVLKELWEIKDGLATECGHDLRRLFDKLKASQKDHGADLVNRTQKQMQLKILDNPKEDRLTGG